MGIMYIYMQSQKQFALLVITAMALWQATHALGHLRMSCHKPIVINARAHCFIDLIYIYIYIYTYICISVCVWLLLLICLHISANPYSYFLFLLLISKGSKDRV